MGDAKALREKAARKAARASAAGGKASHKKNDYRMMFPGWPVSFLGSSSGQIDLLRLLLLFAPYV